MAEYHFTLLIDQAILDVQSSDSFCIAKKVGDTFTTVFTDGSVKPKMADQKNLLSSNDFKWQDRFRIYAAADYAVGQLVHTATNQVEIAFGQQSVFGGSKFSAVSTADRNDFPNPKGPESYEDSFLLKSLSSKYHAAVDCWTEGAWAPIYVDPDTHAGTMDISLTPLNSYMVFWSNKVQTSSMIAVAKLHKPYIFSFDAGALNKTIRYGYAIPEKRAPGEEAYFYPA